MTPTIEHSNEKLGVEGASRHRICPLSLGLSNPFAFKKKFKIT